MFWPFAAKRAWEMKNGRSVPGICHGNGDPGVFLTSVLPLQIQKIIKEPAPDSGLLSLFQGQNPLFS